MKKKMYWGIASLILIIGVACVYFMLQPETEPEPETRYIVPSEADLKRAREAGKPSSVSEVVKPPPAEWDKVFVSDENTAPNADRGQIRNDGQVLALSSTTENPQRRRVPREGEVKPGHFHSYDEDGYLVCDENGNLIQTPYGDPAFHIFTTIGFRPTYEEYQEYKKLVAQANGAYTAGNMAENDRLIAEVLQFRRDHQGELPDLTATTVLPDDHTPDSPGVKARISRLSSAKLNQIYREWGLGYLLED